MNITEQVILDLLPIYAAGEASADTIQLVEAYLAAHPGFANKIEPLLKDTDVNNVTLNQTSVEEKEMTVLNQTRSLLRWKSIAMGFAIFFSLAPLSFRFSSADGFYWIFENSPVAALVYGIFGAGCWLAFLAFQQKLKSTQL